MAATRVRFAPSPTGQLNLGGARSALFNFLFARNTGGEFLLRFEDTDRARLVEGAEGQISQSLDWLKLKPDHGPVRQSDRLARYQKQAQSLQTKGELYPCWCSPERLTQLRKEAQAKKVAFKYDRYCLDHPEDPKKSHVLRFKVPDQPDLIRWEDAIKGPVEIRISTLDDFVALKSDGYPTYHFANVVDDYEMQISHVLRADEWLASTPKHLLLYQAFGWQPPVFGHLPAVLGTEGGQKLSKRHGAASVLEYRDKGYLADALVNFLALLGWNPGQGSTQEIFGRDELYQAFSLDHIQKSPAVFDPGRLDWLNGEYIRKLAPTELEQAAEPFWANSAKDAEPSYRRQVLGLLQDRLKYFGELPELSDFFFADPKPDLESAKIDQADRAKLLKQTREALAESSFKPADLEAELRGLAEQTGTKTGPLFGLIRLAVTGRTAAPGLFETMAVLGQETVMRRLKQALQVT